MALPYAQSMRSNPIGLSKSRVMAGLQCHKRLWWAVHEPAAPELEFDATVQAAFDRGTRVGLVAREYVPGGVTIDLPYNAYAERVRMTQQALDRGAPAIYEASFRAGGVFVAVDILEWGNPDFRLIEVKSSTSVKEQYVADVAIQAHVLRQSGLPLGRQELMHLNRECAYPDLSNLFTRTDVSEAVAPVEADVPVTVAQQLEMLRGPVPDVPTGPHCSTPYACPFMARCWPELPPHHVTTLYSMKRRAMALDDQGYQTIYDLPEEVSLGRIATRQRRAVQENRLIVEPTLSQALAQFRSPLAFLDFETVGLAIPVWNGCHPYDQVPVQFNCHVEGTDGRVVHHEWLADGPGDPRPALAERLIRACDGAQAIVTYNVSFERGRIVEMAEALPALAEPLRHVAARLIDLLPVIRNHVYHPDFGGSFSLKRVLPALVPELRYDNLAINEGGLASLELERLLFNGADLTPEAKAQLRADLLRYCHQDTWGLVRLLRRLRELAPR